MEKNGTTPAPIGPAEQSHDALKAVMLIVLFFVTFLASTASIPLRNFVLARAHSSSHVNRLFSLVSCFGAAWHRLSNVGFLLVLLLEQIALYAFEWFGVSPMGALFGQSQQQQLRSSDEQLVSASTSADLHDPSLSSPVQQQPLSPTVEEEEQQQQTHNESNNSDFGEQLSTMRVFLLLFALMMHACCEGISIGTFTDVAVLFQIFAALLIHKSIVGFSLGLRLVQSNLRTIIVVFCCALFALQVLVGGFISLAIMDILAGKVSMFLLSAISQAIACGTFLYITTFEILPHELSAHSQETENGSRPQKILALLAGFELFREICRRSRHHTFFMGLYINILLVLLVLFVHLFRRYSGRLVAFVLQRLLHARSARIDGLGWFTLRGGELLLANGLHIEVRELHIHSLFNLWRPSGQHPSLNIRAWVGVLRIGKMVTNEDNGGDEAGRNWKEKTEKESFGDGTSGSANDRRNLLVEQCGALDSISIHLYSNRSS
uniref:Uncharacterized protein n=1 Tax=Globodera rostochiensis TaxID=31243 RepID=A0A914GRG5_GLORO